MELNVQNSKLLAQCFSTFLNDIRTILQYSFLDHIFNQVPAFVNCLPLISFIYIFLWQDVYLTYILNELAGKSCIIFCGTCANTQRITLMLRNLGMNAIPLHGQLSQVRFPATFSGT